LERTLEHSSPEEKSAACWVDSDLEEDYSEQGSAEATPASEAEKWPVCWVDSDLVE